MKVTVGSSVSHPEGWHLFKVLDEEETQGKFGTQIKFSVLSSAKGEDGEPIELSYFTGAKLAQHEKCKLTNLFIACGIVDSFDEIDDNEEEWDTAVLIGKIFEGRVDEPTTEGGYPNIGAVRRRRIKRKSEPATKKIEKTDLSDPFEDE